MVAVVPLYHLWSAVRVCLLIVPSPITGSFQGQLYAIPEASVKMSLGRFIPLLIWRVRIKVTGWGYLSVQ